MTYTVRHVRARNAPHRRHPRSGHGHRDRGAGGLVGPRAARGAVLRLRPQPRGSVDDAVGRALAPDRARRGAPALRDRAHAHPTSPAGLVAGVLAAAAGVWLAVGVAVWSWAPVGAPVAGVPAADGISAAEQIGMASGLGAVVTLLAGLAIGRFSVRGTRDVAAAQRQESDRRGSRSEPAPAAPRQRLRPRTGRRRLRRPRAATVGESPGPETHGCLSEGGPGPGEVSPGRRPGSLTRAPADVGPAIPKAGTPSTAANRALLRAQRGRGGSGGLGVVAHRDVRRSSGDRQGANGAGSGCAGATLGQLCPSSTSPLRRYRRESGTTS